MENLVNPNIAYIFWMVSVLLAILAVLSPGTGLLEASALAGLLLTGYISYQLPLNLWALILFIPAAFAFYFVVWKRRARKYLTGAIILFLGGAAWLYWGNNLQPAVHPLVLLLVSVLEGGLLWLITLKILEAARARPAQDLAAIVGARGEARTIVYAEGSVYVGGELWSARSQVTIPKGSRVRVIGREGFILDVEEIKPS